MIFLTSSTPPRQIVNGFSDHLHSRIRNLRSWCSSRNRLAARTGVSATLITSSLRPFHLLIPNNRSFQPAPSLYSPRNPEFTSYISTSYISSNSIFPLRPSFVIPNNVHLGNQDRSRQIRRLYRSVPTSGIDRLPAVAIG